MKKILIRFCCVLLSMILFAGSALAEYDPIIVKIGDFSYTRSQVMSAYELSLEMYRAYGTTLDTETKQKIKDEVIANFVKQAVADNKMRELGLDVMTPADEAELLQTAQKSYDELLDQYADAIMDRYDCDAEKARNAAPVFLDLEGITLDLLTEQARTNKKQERLTCFVCHKVERLTEEEVLEWYEKNYVAPCRDRYQGNVTLFEEEVLVGGEETFYMPEGYRMIKTISLTASEEEQDNAYLIQNSLTAAQAEVERLDKVLYGTRLLGEDDTAAEAELEAARSKVQNLEQDLQALYQKMAEEVADEIADITARLEAGESFDTLRKEYDRTPEPQEEGYPVHPESVIWDDSFKTAALELRQPGDTTGPVLTSVGPQFLTFAGDAPQGDLPLEKADAEAVTWAAQAEKDNDLLLASIFTWPQDYEAEIHPEKLIIR